MPGRDTEVLVVGAGPYGLAAAVQLRRAGVATVVVGDPLSFWRRMPPGMFLRSNFGATNMIELVGPYSLDSFRSATGTAIAEPVPLETFVSYGEWVQQTAVPDVEKRTVIGIDRADGGFAAEFADGDRLIAGRVVVACGIAPFAWRPPEFAGLPSTLASHTSDYGDLSVFDGRSVALVGGGQSALESAALLREQGAGVEVLVRSSRIIWLRGHAVKQRIGRLGPILYAPTDVGPLWYSRLVSRPDIFRFVPRPAQTRIARRSIRPAGSHFLRGRLEATPITLAVQVVSAEPEDGRLRLELSDGSRRIVDHLMFGTGFRIHVARYGLLSDGLLSALATVNGYPRLGRGLESSVPGLHFLGAPAAWSVGPTMRFISGSWYASRSLAEGISVSP
jgi:FAD-dependent urate hydroxylase